MSEPVRISNSPSIFVDENIHSTNIIVSGAIGSTVSAGGTVSGGVSIAESFSKINNVPTFGLGIPAIYGYGRILNQTTVNTILTFTPGGTNDGSYWVSANVNLLGSTGPGSLLMNVNIQYTDETNNPQNIPLFFVGPGGVFGASITDTIGVGPYEGMPVHIRAKSSNNIILSTLISGLRTPDYNAEGLLLQLI